MQPLDQLPCTRPAARRPCSTLILKGTRRSFAGDDAQRAAFGIGQSLSNAVTPPKIVLKGVIAAESTASPPWRMPTTKPTGPNPKSNKPPAPSS
ncbi:MAG: hypothetical protein IPK32_26575 [Verrucomicrobiaceae bacterium]|nr:hypothetical protein [Verrucomicrobiaceae bacterium]